MKENFRNFDEIGTGAAAPVNRSTPFASGGFLPPAAAIKLFSGIRQPIGLHRFTDRWSTASPDRPPRHTQCLCRITRKPTHDVRAHERMHLAEASEASHPARAWTVYADHVENSVRSGGQRNYEEACRFLERIGRLRAGLGEADAHAVWLDDLALRHKAKRNFMKLLGR